MGVVDVGGCGIGEAGFEQAGLGLKVVVEVGVEVEVVVRQVGEAGGGEPGAVDPVHHQGVGRHLDGGQPHAGVDHAGQQSLELGGLRGRPLARNDLPGDASADRADHARRDAGGAGDVLQQKGRRRLAVGAGDAEHRQLRRRLAPGGGRHRAHRRPHRGDPHLGHRQPERALDQQGRRPGGHGGRSVVVAVGGRARDAAEEVAGADSPAVVRDRCDLGARISPQLEHVDRVEELVEQQA